MMRLRRCYTVSMATLIFLPLLQTMGQCAEEGRLPMLTNDEAWSKLPAVKEKPLQLPNWAKMLAASMPKTTAAMLELDGHHRTGDRLPAVLRGKLRWIAADANQSEYAKAEAAGDLKRAGQSAADLKALAEGKYSSEPERKALVFARKMMVDANTVTDDEVKDLIRIYGDGPFVGMVKLLAHAAFQDRVLLALNPPIEKEVPPPITTKFPRMRTPAGPPPKMPSGFKPPLPAEDRLPNAADRDWQSKSVNDLQRLLGNQKERTSRIRVPDWSEVGPKLDSESWGHRLPLVLWNRVAYAHQPEATDLWFDTVDQFRQESKMDRVFAQYIFWVVTRANDCFY